MVHAQTQPTDETDPIKIGSANLKEGNYEEAVEDFKRAREEDPGSSIAAYFLGIAYKKVQDYKEAKVHLRDALTLRPAVKEAVAELTDVLYQLGEMGAALNELENAEKEGIESAQTIFLKGLVLLKLGRGKEAIDSFKKAESLDDKLTQSADYQIALATLQEGKLEEARTILKEIVVRDPNSDIAQFANQYIDAITKRLKEERPFRATVGLQYQYDDNVLLKPGDATVAGDITGEADSTSIVTLRAEYVPRLRGPYGLKTQYSLYLNSHYHITSYDIFSHTLAIVPSYNFEKSQISILTSYNYTLVDDYKYLQTMTFSPTYALILSGNQFIQALARYQHKEYLRPPINNNEDRDSDDYGAGLSWFYLIAKNKGFVNGRYEINWEDAQGKNWVYSGNKFGLGLLYPLMEKLKLNVGGEVYLQNFEDIHTVFNKRREDKTYTFNTLLSYAIYDDIDIQAQYVFSRGDSNIAVYDYDKNVVSVGVEARF